jgi:hypothetical protein
VSFRSRLQALEKRRRAQYPWRVLAARTHAEAAAALASMTEQQRQRTQVVVGVDLDVVLGLKAGLMR